jgi:hypothetical protein
MWGVGIITYILLAGYPPFYDENNPGDDTALFEKVPLLPIAPLPPYLCKYLLIFVF